MFIQTEHTPNPASLKFLPGCEVMPQGTANFPDADAAAKSPLARRLFEVSGVTGVFFGSDFITVTAPDADWAELKTEILAGIMDHFTSGQPVVDPAAQALESAEGEDDEIAAQIKELLDTRVRPAVAQDGGDIVYHGFKDGVVYLHMQGSCAGCPSSVLTLKHGIENLLRHYVPEVTEVQQI
jgi:Fe-S cluster biogenesis protein NfuA